MLLESSVAVSVDSDEGPISFNAVVADFEATHGLACHALRAAGVTSQERRVAWRMDVEAEVGPDVAPVTVTLGSAATFTEWFRMPRLKRFRMPP